MNNENLETALGDLCSAIRNVTLGNIESSVMDAAARELIANWNDNNPDDVINEAEELANWAKLNGQPNNLGDAPSPTGTDRRHAILHFIECRHRLPADVTALERDVLSDLFHETDGEVYLTTLGEMELEEPVDILPTEIFQSYKQHSIVGLSATEITAKIGFAANLKDDLSKVKFSWGFTVNGKACAVWDWKGSHLINEFSAYGPIPELRLVFGDKLITWQETRP